MARVVNHDDAELLSQSTVTCLGFGSLMSLSSAESTFPRLTNFRLASIRGYRRLFGHIATIFIERGIANCATREMSSLSVEPSCADDELLVTAFDIPSSDLPAFFKREPEFKWTLLPYKDLSLSDLDPQSHSNSTAAVPPVGLICCAFTESEYRSTGRSTSAIGSVFESECIKYGIDRVWCDDLLPCRVYLRHCILASHNCDKRFDKELKAASTSTRSNKTITMHMSDSFLDQTVLGDRKTTLRQYMSRHPDIMKETPPPEFAKRYGG